MNISRGSDNKPILKQINPTNTPKVGNVKTIGQTDTLNIFNSNINGQPIAQIDINSISYINDITLGTAAPNKLITTDNNKNVLGINNLDISKLKLNGVSIGATSSGGPSNVLALNNISTTGVVQQNKAIMPDSNLNIKNANVIKSTSFDINSVTTTNSNPCFNDDYIVQKVSKYLQINSFDGRGYTIKKNNKYFTVYNNVITYYDSLDATTFSTVTISNMGTTYHSYTLEYCFDNYYIIYQPTTTSVVILSSSSLSNTTWTQVLSINTASAYTTPIKIVYSATLNILAISANKVYYTTDGSTFNLYSLANNAEYIVRNQTDDNFIIASGTNLILTDFTNSTTKTLPSATISASNFINNKGIVFATTSGFIFSNDLDNFISITNMQYFLNNTLTNVLYYPNANCFICFNGDPKSVLYYTFDGVNYKNTLFYNSVTNSGAYSHYLNFVDDYLCLKYKSGIVMYKFNLVKSYSYNNTYFGNELQNLIPVGSNSNTNYIYNITYVDFMDTYFLYTANGWFTTKSLLNMKMVPYAPLDGTSETDLAGLDRIQYSNDFNKVVIFSNSQVYKNNTTGYTNYVYLNGTKIIPSVISASQTIYEMSVDQHGYFVFTTVQTGISTYYNQTTYYTNDFVNFTTSTTTAFDFASKKYIPRMNAYVDDRNEYVYTINRPITVYDPENNSQSYSLSGTANVTALQPIYSKKYNLFFLQTGNGTLYKTTTINYTTMAFNTNSASNPYTTNGNPPFITYIDELDMFISISSNSNNHMAYSFNGTNWYQVYLYTPYNCSFRGQSYIKYQPRIFVDNKTGYLFFLNVNSVATLRTRNPFNANVTKIHDFLSSQYVFSQNTIYNKYAINNFNLLSASEISGINWTSIAYGKNLYIALANDNVIYSNNLNTWTSILLSGTWNHIYYAFNYFIIVGNNEIAYSLDGINWTNVSLSGNWQSSTYNLGKYYICTTDKIAYSSNLSSWTIIDLIGPWVSITYQNNVFVAVGDNKIAYSKNGTSWSTITLSGSWKSITFGNGYFAIVGTNCIGYSMDAVTWYTNTITGNWTYISYCYEINSFLLSGNNLCKVIIELHKLVNTPNVYLTELLSITSPINTNWNKSLYLERLGMFILVGNGYIATSNSFLIGMDCFVSKNNSLSGINLPSQSAIGSVFGNTKYFSDRTSFNLQSQDGNLVYLKRDTNKTCLYSLSNSGVYTLNLSNNLEINTTNPAFLYINNVQLPAINKLNSLYIPTFGTASSNKALSTDSNNNVSNINSLSTKSIYINEKLYTGQQTHSSTSGTATSNTALLTDNNNSITGINTLSSKNITIGNDTFMGTTSVVYDKYHKASILQPYSKYVKYFSNINTTPMTPYLSCVNAIAYSSELNIYVAGGISQNTSNVCGTFNLGYSYDGINWIASTSVYADTINYIKWVPNLNVFTLTCSSRILYSKDGIKWSACKTPVSIGSNFSNPVYISNINAVFVSTINSSFYYSSDGINYQLPTTNTQLSSSNFYYGEFMPSVNRLIYISRDYSGLYYSNQITSISDLNTVTFTKITLNNPRSLYYNTNDSTMYVVGDSSLLKYSTDGINWTTVPTTQMPSTSTLLQIRYYPEKSKFIINANSQIWSSTTGTTSWTSISGGGVGISYIDICNGYLFQGILANNGPSWSKLHRTNDISSLSYSNAYTNNSFIKFDLPAFTYMKWCKAFGLYLCADITNRMGSYGLYYSYDGLTWTQIQINIQNPIIYVHNDSDNTGKAFIASASAIYKSTDGINWTVIKSVSNVLGGLCYNPSNNKLVAVQLPNTTANYYTTIDDGATWYNDVVPDSNILLCSGAVYSPDNNIYYMIAQSSKTFCYYCVDDTNSNGLIWTKYDLQSSVFSLQYINNIKSKYIPEIKTLFVIEDNSFFYNINGAGLVKFALTSTNQNIFIRDVCYCDKLNGVIVLSRKNNYNSTALFYLPQDMSSLIPLPCPKILLNPYICMEYDSINSQLTLVLGNRAYDENIRFSQIAYINFNDEELKDNYDKFEINKRMMNKYKNTDLTSLTTKLLNNRRYYTTSSSSILTNNKVYFSNSHNCFFSNVIGTDTKLYYSNDATSYLIPSANMPNAIAAMSTTDHYYDDYILNKDTFMISTAGNAYFLTNKNTSALSQVTNPDSHVSKYIKYLQCSKVFVSLPSSSSNYYYVFPISSNVTTGYRVYLQSADTYSIIQELPNGLILFLSNTTSYVYTTDIYSGSFQSNTLPIDSNWISSAYSTFANVMTLLSSSGSVLYTNDGLNWTSSSITASNSVTFTEIKYIPDINMFITYNTLSSYNPFYYLYSTSSDTGSYSWLESSSSQEISVNGLDYSPILKRFIFNLGEQNFAASDFAEIGMGNLLPARSTVALNSFDKSISYDIETGNTIMMTTGTKPTSFSYQLYVGGDAYKPSSSSWTVTSDERIKKDIEISNNELCYNNVKELELKRYKYKNEYIDNSNDTYDTYQLGWIAQDVKQIIPKAVKENKLFDIDDCNILDNDQIKKMLYGTVKHLIAKIKKQKQILEQI